MDTQKNSLLLKIEDLKTYFYTDRGVVKAVDGLNLNLSSGETLALVGESGSGKTVSALSILRLVPQPPGKIVSGRIIFQNEDLLSKKEKDMREIRGKKISMIFQDPFTSLNPVFTIGEQIMEVLMAHEKMKKKEAYNRTVEILKTVKIPQPEKRVTDYPHQLSGGMRQRAMIAMALVGNPRLLLADEPTTALDVTIQAQILQLLAELRVKQNLSIILITHNLGIVAALCDKIVVMYAGRIMEQGPTVSIFENPLHPYTRGLLSCLPDLTSKSQRLKDIKGLPPDLINLPRGCPFHPRCSHRLNQCDKEMPPGKEVEPAHITYCWQE